MPVHMLNIIPPVSVCHHVSTIGQASLPIVLKYHIQTSGFMGSPTVPRSLSDERSKEFGIASPYFMYILSAVGVVYSMVAPYFSTIAQYLSGFGKSGAPSYIISVTPCISGA